MQNEQTLRRMRGQMKASAYRSAYAVEIGVLSWVLGEAESVRAGVMAEREITENAPIVKGGPKTGVRKWSQWSKIR